MKKELLQRARKMVLNHYGNSFAGKATDEFCVHAASFHAILGSLSFDLQNFSSTQHSIGLHLGIIVEFTDEPVNKNINADNLVSMIREAKELIKGLAEGKKLLLNIEQTVRQRKMKKYREEVIKSIHPLNAFIERSLESSFAHSSQSLQHLPFLTKTCWLNQTVKTIADRKTLAEAALDFRITKLDIPKKLIPEIHETGKTVCAPEYRKKFSLSGKGIVVAVIDSEVFLDHKALANRVVHRENYTKEPWGHPANHATGIAGIIASDDLEFTGMAPEATIYNYKVLSANPALNSDDFQASCAIQKALEDGAHIANCSWGIDEAKDGSSRESRAVNNAWEYGLTVVKSAGNKGPRSKSITTPGDADGVIVVGSTTKNGMKVELTSSRGPFASGKNRPHLVAPGGSVREGIFSCLSAGGFGNVGVGTSFAAPHVSGLLALILEQNPSFSPEEQRNYLLKLCSKIDGFVLDDEGFVRITMASLI